MNEDNIDIQSFEVVAEIFMINSSKKSFYKVRRPSYEDVALLMNKMQLFKGKCKEDSGLWKRLVDISRVILQKAITV